MKWKRDALRVLVLDDGLAKVAAAPSGGGCFVEVFGVSVGRVALDELAAQHMVERLVEGSRGVGAWRFGYQAGTREGFEAAAAHAGDSATAVLEELERRLGRA